MNTQTGLVAEQIRLQQWADQIRDCASLFLDHFGLGEKICKESTVGVILMGSQFCECEIRVNFRVNVKSCALAN